MKRYELSTNANNELECSFVKGKSDKIIKVDIDAIKMADRISMSANSRVVIRDTALPRYKTTKDDMRIIDNDKIISIVNYNQTLPKVQETKKKHSISARILSRLIPYGVVTGLGIGVLACLFNTAGKELTEDIANKHDKINVESLTEGLEESNEITTTQGTVVTIGDDLAFTKQVIEESLNKEEEKEEAPIDATTITESDIDEALSQEEIASIVNEPAPEINNEDLVASYNKDRVFTGYQRNVDVDINNNIAKIADEIKAVSEETGISENLIIDTISQESHGGTLQNIGQIEWGAWVNQPFDVYNYKADRNEKVVFSNDKQRWNGKVDVIFTQEDLKDKQTNILASFKIMESYIQQFGSIPLGIQAYNMGPGNVRRFIAAAINNGEITEEEAKNLTNQQAFDLIEKHAAKDGDTGKTYVANVFEKEDNTDRQGLNQYKAFIRVNGETVELNLQAENLVEESTGKTL